MDFVSNSVKAVLVGSRSRVHIAMCLRVLRDALVTVSERALVRASSREQGTFSVGGVNIKEAVALAGKECMYHSIRICKVP